MSQRNIHKTARIAVQVRKVQDQAALSRVQAQQKIVASATRDHEEAIRAEADSQDAWRRSIDGPAFNLDLMTAWHHQTFLSANDRSLSEARLQAEQATALEHVSAWRRQLSLTQAAVSVLLRAERRTQRLTDEALLATAEDIRNARWGRK